MKHTTFDLPQLGRAAEFRASSINEEARTVEVLFSTGAAVRRATWDWDEGIRQYEEELTVSDNAMRLERINGGAPFLNSHNAYDLASIIGVVEPGSVRIEGGMAYATIRFSERDEVQPIWRDVKAGIIRNVSVGYRVHRYEVTKEDGKLDLYRAVDWEPMEISAVAIGADPGAQVRSANSDNRAPNSCVVVRADAGAAKAAVHQRSLSMEETENTASGAATLPETTRAAHVPPVTAPAPSADEVRAAANRESADILRLCDRAGLSGEFSRTLIEQNVTLDTARARILDAMHERDERNAGRVASAPASVAGSRQDETETRRTAMEDALFAGLTRGEAVPDHARHYAGHSIVELACDRLEERRVPGSFGQREAILQRAFHSTSDFPLLFENAMNRALQARYMEAQPTYRRLARQRTYSDFRDHHSVRVGDFPTLQEVSPEAGEILGGTFSESKEVTAVKAYGVRVNISRQMLVNDSLNGIQQVLNDRGMAVARFEDANFYAMMLGGSNADGPTLLETTRQVFNTTDTTKAGAAAAITVASLSIGRASIRKKKSLDGADLGLTASVLLVGPDKETEAQQIVAPIQAQQAGNVNPFSGILSVVTTAKITGNSWYLFASPDEAPCFEWGLLEGYEAPRFRIEDVFGVQGTALTLEHDFGCGAIDFRGGFKNAGA